MNDSEMLDWVESSLSDFFMIEENGSEKYVLTFFLTPNPQIFETETVEGKSLRDCIRKAEEIQSSYELYSYSESCEGC